MADNSFQLTWSIKHDKVRYRLNEKDMGTGEAGFDQVLKELSKTGAKKIIIKYPVTNATGGMSVEDTFPFSKRLPEFLKQVKEQNMTVEYQPLF